MRGQTTSQAPNQGRNGGAGILPGPQSLYNLLPAAGQTQPEAVSGAEARGSQGFWEGNLQLTLVFSLPISGWAYKHPPWKTQQQLVTSRNLSCAHQTHCPV